MSEHKNLLSPPPVLLPEGCSNTEPATSQSVADIVASHLDCPGAWAQLALDQLRAATTLEQRLLAYACARTGYHRGLDLLRKNGWKGFGPVPYSHVPNRGVLRAFAVLADAAAAVGEDDEVTRLHDLLADCDPTAAKELLGD